MPLRQAVNDRGKLIKPVVILLFSENCIFFNLRYTCFVDWCKDDIKSSASGIITYLSSLIWNQPREANFFAYFKRTERLNSQDILFLICCPANLREMVKEEHDKEGITSCDVSSRRMIPGQEAFVFVSGGMCPVSLDDMDDFCLRYLSLQYTEGYAGGIFYCSVSLSRNH